MPVLSDTSPAMQALDRADGGPYPLIGSYRSYIETIMIQIQEPHSMYFTATKAEVNTIYTAVDELVKGCEKGKIAIHASSDTKPAVKELSQLKRQIEQFNKRLNAAEVSIEKRVTDLKDACLNTEPDKLIPWFISRALVNGEHTKINKKRKSAMQREATRLGVFERKLSEWKSKWLVE